MYIYERCFFSDMKRTFLIMRQCNKNYVTTIRYDRRRFYTHKSNTVLSLAAISNNTDTDNKYG